MIIQQWMHHLPVTTTTTTIIITILLPPPPRPPLHDILRTLPVHDIAVLRAVQEYVHPLVVVVHDDNRTRSLDTVDNNVD